MKAYFESWREDLQRAKKLLSNKSYNLEGIPVLSCNIAALGSLRFPGPTIQDDEAYFFNGYVPSQETTDRIAA